jgi:hypothetical protein
MDRFDSFEKYCTQLGMLMPFSYCRSQQRGLPCRGIILCWEERLPVLEFLLDHFSRDDLEPIFGTLPPTRLGNLVAQVQQVKSQEGN